MAAASRGRRRPAASAAAPAAAVAAPQQAHERERQPACTPDQSTASPERAPQLKPSSGRFRLTISSRNSPGTRDGRPTMTIWSPTCSVSRVMPWLPSWPVPLHSTAQRCCAPLSSGAWMVHERVRVAVDELDQLALDRHLLGRGRRWRRTSDARAPPVTARSGSAIARGEPSSRHRSLHCSRSCQAAIHRLHEHRRRPRPVVAP